jgi:CubicO group peptidase (beta-lactamase class C family)
MLMTLITGFFSGWVLLAAILLGSVPQQKVITGLSMFVAITIGVGWLVARFIASARSVGRIVGSTLAFILVAWIGWSLINPDAALFLARDIGFESTVKDYERFPQRAISNAASAFHFKQNLSPKLFQTIEYRSDGGLKQMGFEDFLQSTETTSFIVIKDDAILYEGYFNGYNRDSIVTSFSVAKSFTSTLIGIAIDEGYIGSVDDLMITYIPELKGKGFDGLTIRHLLTMSSGIQYLTDDELPPLKEVFQFTDDGMSYSYPDRRNLILQVKPDGKPLGSEFNYSNYNTLLLGMILERTTGRSPSEYLQEKIWKPLGMEYPASWSLESEKTGFELVISGINARAIDFAKFGRLFLNNGNWNGAQIISSDWISESTSPDPNDHRVWHSDTYWKDLNGYYKYQWWGRLNPDGTYHYTALGKFGQFIFVAPQENMIIVRFGMDEGGVDDWMSVFQTITANVSGKTISNPVAQPWSVSTPEEQGFDSARLAEGLLAIKEQGTQIHSLMILRNDRLILDAYFDPYDGSIYHDLASVTKSLMTTLIGIAADQGKLSLDDPLLSFFPDRDIANRDERKERITIRHLVSMSSGLDCGAENEATTLKMRSSPDPVRFALDRPVVWEPGTRFEYCNLDMHLLSAVLQESTGMTALEFARINLFAPLGIQDVYWPADSQGVTHGWGDVCLHPVDMAKIGLLFLHQGQWQGQQIISREWIESATQIQITDTGKIEEYGYGWWVSSKKEEPVFFRADGGGGQRILVIPRWNMVLVTTGGGFELPEIEEFLIQAIVDLDNPLPSNPTGVSRLNAALIAIDQGPGPQPVPSLPVTAREISGQTFIFEPNPALLSFRLDFDQSAEAVFQLEVANESEPRVTAVGLDGVYRSSRVGRPIIARGVWENEQTFVIDYDEGPGISYYTFRLYFDGDKVIFTAPGWSIEANKK